MKEFLYHYRVYPETARVIDGDTVEITIDVGFKQTSRWIIRFYAIDAPELRGVDKEEKASGLMSKAFVQHWFTEAAQPGRPKMYLHTIGKQDSFGRWMGIFEYDGVSLNDLLLKENYAEPYKS